MKYWKTGILLALLSVESYAIDISRVSVSSTSVQGNNFNRSATISSDGRYVAFTSFSNNLVVGDTNNEGDIFVHDRDTGITTRISVATNGAEGNLESSLPSLSSNGRYISFSSSASNLVPGDTNAASDVFVHDRDTGITTRISVATNGAEGNGASVAPSISSDGQYVIFSSLADNLISGITNTARGFFMHDRHSGVTSQITTVVDGVELLGSPSEYSFSLDSRYIVFSGSESPSIPFSIVAARTDIYVYDRNTRITSLVSRSSSGVVGNARSSDASLSADGRYVVFTSDASNLVMNDTNSKRDVFVHDRDTGETSRVNVSSSGDEVVIYPSSNPSLSSNGRYVSFSSSASNLVSGDVNEASDVFVHDRFTGATNRVSKTPSMTEANGDSFNPTFSATGRHLVFLSEATNLVNSDTNQKTDVFVADLVSLIGNNVLNDFDGNGRSDVFWRNTVTNANRIYYMNGNLIDTETDISILSVNDPAWSVVGNGDFNNDGQSDILWRNNTTGLNHISLMNGTQAPIGVDLSIPALSDQKWKLAGVGDFDGDGNADLFWHHDEGENRITFMDGTTQRVTSIVNTIIDPLWKVSGITDFDLDGKADVLWRHAGNKRVWLYLMNGSVVLNGGGTGEHVVFTSENWNIQGVGDFNADGRGDILWRNSANGRVWLYQMKGATITNQTTDNGTFSLGEHVAFTGLDWDIKALGDYNGDGKQDIFWRNSIYGWNHLYLMDGSNLAPADGLGVNTLPNLNWHVIQ